jgi:long-subunit fatty acid transport protein
MRLLLLPRVVLASLALACATTASAQLGVSFNRTGSGARAAGMANAFIAVSDDGTAASWNPSGLAQLRKPELSIVSTTSGDSARVAGFRTRDDLASFSSAESSYRSTYPDFASLAVPVTLWKKPVTFQGAWRRLYSLDYRELISVTRLPLAPEGPPAARFEGNSDVLGAVDLFSAAAAAKLTTHLSLGASLNFWSGDWTEDNLLSETPLDAPGVTKFESVSTASRVRGQSFVLGMMLTYPRFGLGIVYQNPLTSDFDTSVVVVSSEVEGVVTQQAEGKLHFPRAWGLGGAWRPASRWTVALDFTWDDWTEAVIDTPETGRISLLDGLPGDQSSSRDTWSVNAGAERLFTGDGFVVPLRFGLAWEPQGARDPYTRDPVDFVMLALGTGYNTNSLKFDAAFQYRWASFQSGADVGPGASNPLLPAAVGERRNSQWRLKLSLILRLTDTDKLKRTLGKVFG